MSVCLSVGFVLHLQVCVRQTRSTSVLCISWYAAQTPRHLPRASNFSKLCIAHGCLTCPCTQHVTGFKRRRSLIFKTFSVSLICSRSGQIFHINYVLLPGFVKRTRAPNCRACELWQQPLYCSDLLKCLRHDWLPVLPSPQRSGRL